MNSTQEKCSKPSAVRKNPCLKSTTDKLYEQRHETGDITFVIGSEEIPAHRCVLAALSPRYKAQFYGAMAEHKTINVQDVSPGAFKEFLQFFYLDEVTLTLENIEDVLNMAKQSLVDELVSECVNFLLDVVGMDKLVWCYRLAVDYDIEPLEIFCVKRISSNIKSVFKMPDFLSCDHGMLCHILDFDSLNCDEMNVFVACLAWARAKCEHDGVDATETKNLRAALGDTIFKIRFCSMTVERFAAIEKRFAGLFLSEESTEVYRTIALKANGETSAIFGVNNSKPRKTMPSILECSFSTGSPIKFSSPVDSDCMDFSCDKAINLNGFVICNRIDDDLIVHVDLNGVLQRFDSTKSVLGGETRIIFADPISIKAHELCQIVIASETFKESSGKWCGYNAMKTVVRNDVTFDFPKLFWEEINLITRLMFSINDDQKNVVENNPRNSPNEQICNSKSICLYFLSNSSKINENKIRFL